MANSETAMLPALREPSAVERAFLPAALEIVETPASPTLRVTALSICAVFAIGIAWACFGKVDIVAVASGKVIATGRTKVVQPMEIGVVRAIHVDEGQHVTAGQLLIELDPTTSRAETEHAAKEFSAAELDRARLKALIDDTRGDPFATVANADPADIADERTRMESQRSQQQAKLAGLARTLAQKQAEAAEVRATLDKIDTEMPLAEQRATIRRKSAESGYGSQLSYIDAEQQRLDLSTEEPIERKKLDEATAAIETTKRNIEEARAEYTSTLESDLSKADEQASEAREALAKASERSRLQQLRAPVDGTVQNLTVHTLGAVVTPAEQLLSVVPSADGVMVEAVVENRDIGFVHAGQRAEIKVETFPFTRYGLIHGTVQSIGTDAIVNEAQQQRNESTRRNADEPSVEQRAQQLIYTARVALNQTEMNIDGHEVPLRPGMAVTVEMKTGQRRVISYLLSPLSDYYHGAIHER